MATTHSCAIAALQSNTGQEDLGAARHATRTLTHRHALNEQNYKRAQRALAGQALRAARLHGTRQLNADEVIGARQPIGASAVQGRGVRIWKKSLTKTDKRSRRRRVRGRKYFRLLAELLRLSKYHESISRPLTLLRCFGEVDVRCAEG